jgi:hypothetical protein
MSGLTQVGLVNVLDPISQDREWNDQKIKFENPFSVFRRIIIGEPLDMPPSSAVHRVLDHG